MHNDLLLLVVLIVDVIEKYSFSKLLLATVLCIFMHFVHQRTIAIVAAYILLFIVMVMKEKIPVHHAVNVKQYVLLKTLVFMKANLSGEKTVLIAWHASVTARLRPSNMAKSAMENEDINVLYNKNKDGYQI
jgi:hypothetical protein